MQIAKLARLSCSGFPRSYRHIKSPIFLFLAPNTPLNFSTTTIFFSYIFNSQHVNVMTYCHRSWHFITDTPQCLRTQKIVSIKIMKNYVDKNYEIVYSSHGNISGGQHTTSNVPKIVPFLLPLPARAIRFQNFQSFKTLDIKKNGPNWSRQF